MCTFGKQNGPAQLNTLILPALHFPDVQELRSISDSALTLSGSLDSFSMGCFSSGHTHSEKHQV